MKITIEQEGLMPFWTVRTSSISAGCNISASMFIRFLSQAGFRYISDKEPLVYIGGDRDVFCTWKEMQAAVYHYVHGLVEGTAEEQIVLDAVISWPLYRTYLHLLPVYEKGGEQ